jgi:hypothetical protein
MDRQRTNGFDDSGTRDLAREARRVRDVERRQAMVRKVFVSRTPAPGNGFRWEIRRFGSFVLKAGDVEYDTAAAAQDAGDAVLARWQD